MFLVLSLQFMKMTHVYSNFLLSSSSLKMCDLSRSVLKLRMVLMCFSLDISCFVS